MIKKVKVGINGYGVIGKRIADAVRLQDDMELVGITAKTPDFRLFAAQKMDLPIYGVDDEACSKLMTAGFNNQGNLESLLKKVDIIVDATPKGIASTNKPVYDAAGVKSIFQGGEVHELTGLSFVAQVNYEKSLDKQSLRVVSCNTTAICRITYPFVKMGLLDNANISLARRGADPIDANKQGPLGTIVLEGKIPSHQASDAQTIIPDLQIVTVGFAVPTTLGHLHVAFLRMKNAITKEKVLEILSSTPRVFAVKFSDGITSENHLVELMRDLGRRRSDMWEVAFWEDSLYVDGPDVVFYYQVHNEAIVIPENIDAIRALTGIEKSAKNSIAKTDKLLGVQRKIH